MSKKNNEVILPPRVPKCDFCGEEVEISINNKNIHLCQYCYLDRKYLDKKGGDW